VSWWNEHSAEGRAVAILHGDADPRSRAYTAGRLTLAGLGAFGGGVARTFFRTRLQIVASVTFLYLVIPLELQHLGVINIPFLQSILRALFGP
jgi:hypothetical protein